MNTIPYPYSNIYLIRPVVFPQYTCISELDVDHLQSQYEELLGRIRPNAVGLVDAFDIIDGVSTSKSPLLAWGS